MAKPVFKTSKLMTAIRGNNLNGVIAALDDGDDVEEADIHGFGGLPLRTACFEGNLPIIRELLAHGANVNAPGSSGTGMPLRLALRGGHRVAASLLIKQGAHIPPDLTIDDELLHGAMLSEPIAPENPAFEVPEAITKKAAAEPESNLIEFETSGLQSEIEEVQILSCRGTDTNFLAMDLMRFNDEGDEAAPRTAQETPTETSQKEEAKPSFWQSKQG